MILVTGATGKVGSEAVRLLLDGGQEVEAVTRDPASAALPAGARVVGGNPERNLFVEQMLPGGTLRELGEEEMRWYRRPFLRPGEDRRQPLTWPRQIPVDGEPADVDSIVRSYASWLRSSPVSKLFVNGDPGAALTGSHRDFCRTWPAQREVTVAGLHFLQEDSPDAIGRAIADSLPAVREGRAA